MSLEDLEQAGILLPRDKWGTKNIHTKVAKLPLIIVGVLAPVSGVLMFAGNGTWLTWAGLCLFFLDLVLFTWLNLRGVE